MHVASGNADCILQNCKGKYKMKKVNILQLIASICLLIGSIINLLNLLIEIPFAIYVCTGPLLLISVILFVIVMMKQIKNRKQDKRDQCLFQLYGYLLFANTPVQTPFITFKPTKKRNIFFLRINTFFKMWKRMLFGIFFKTMV